MKKNTIKTIVIAALSALSCSLLADFVTIYHDYALNERPITVWGELAYVSYACSTNSADYKLSFVQSFASKGTQITNAYQLISVNPTSNVTNIVPSTTIYVKPGDYFLCSGTDATNGNANATIFIKR